MEAKKETRIQFLFLIPILLIFCGYFLPLANLNPSTYTVFRGKELHELYTQWLAYAPPAAGYGWLVSIFRAIPVIGFSLFFVGMGKRFLIPLGILYFLLYLFGVLPWFGLLPVLLALLGQRWLAPLSLLFALFCLALTLGIAIPGYDFLVGIANREQLGLPFPNPGLAELVVGGHMGFGYILIAAASVLLIAYALHYFATAGQSTLTVRVENYIYESLRQNIRQYMMIIALLGIWGIFYAITENGLFISPRNLSNLFLQSATVAVIATGVVLVLVTMNIDLSIGSVVGFIGAIAAVTQVDSPIAAFLVGVLNSLGAPLSYMAVLGIVSALLVGLAIGAWHGMWVAYMGVPAFIVTLSSMMVFRGGILYFTGGKSISNMSAWFQAIGMAYVPPGASRWFAIVIILLYLGFELRKRFVRLGYGFAVPSWPVQAAKLAAASAAILLFFEIMIRYQGIPYAWLIVLVVMLLLTFIAEKTTFGRHLYAIGGNPEAARLSGINIKWKILCMYMLIGVVVAIGGIIYLARLNSATANAGNGMELDCIASAVIGGTSLMGGEGFIYGGVVGALVMGSLDNGMSLMNLDATWQYIVKGLVLLFAVWVDMATRKRGN